MNEKKHEIKDWIGSFDNYIDPKVCDAVIDYFEKSKDTVAYDRQSSEKSTMKEKNDLSIGISKRNNWFPEIDQLCLGVQDALKVYEEKTNVIRFCELKEIHFTDLKIQKTIPTGGYHIWHLEKDYVHSPCNRVLVFTIYLNDIDDGGETEFLLMKQRVKPVKGRISIFPAYFPFVHRGNPPLKEDKYIVTSWLVSSI
jgi:hypothetical protein